MADIVKIADSNNVQHDINSKMTRGIVRATLDSASTSTNFIAMAPNITELYDGLSIIMKNTAVASESGCTINLNNLGAKNIYNSKTGNIITSDYDAGTEYIFTFDYANDHWIMQCGYYSVNSDTVGEYAGRIIADENANMVKRSLVMQTQLDPPRFASLVTTSSTKKTKTKRNIGFLPNGVVLYQNGSTIDGGSPSSSDNTWLICPYIDTRYSFNVSSSWGIVAAPLYIKCTMSNGLLYLADTTWWSMELPAANDGFYYVYVGQMRDGCHLEMVSHHPIYYYDSYLDKIVEYVPDIKTPSVSADDVIVDNIRLNSGIDMNAQSNNVNISAIVGQTTPHSESLIHVNSSTEKITLGRALRKWTKIGEVSGATLSTANSITVPYNPYLNPVIPSPTSASEIMVTVEVQITPNYKTYEQWVLPVDQLVDDENSPQHSMRQSRTILMGGFYYSSSYYGSYGVSYDREDFESLGVIFKWATDWAKVQGQGSIEENAYRMCVYYR